MHRKVYLRTSRELYKPDIIMLKYDVAYVVDVQIVKCGDLENDHIAKEQKYSEDVELKDLIKAKYGAAEVEFRACTISYKGIWSKKCGDFDAVGR